MIKTPPALVWHRRDLRLADNPALNRALDSAEQVLGVFIIDPDVIHWEDTAPARVYFLRESVLELQQAYAAIGGRLVIRLGEPVEQLVRLAKSVEAGFLFFNQDIEPYARARDARAHEALEALGIRVYSCPEVLLHQADEVRTQQGKVYTVFTPFWRQWVARPKPKPFETPVKVVSPEVGTEVFPSPAELGKPFTQKLLVTPGEKAGRALLDQFCLEALYSYNDRRDLPSHAGTSLLSAHLKFGTVGIREVWQRTQQSWKLAHTDHQRQNLMVWQQELGWREFYKYVLYHFPHLAEGPFRREFVHFRWDEDRERFERWCQGETGYPFVDAAMRQLNTVCWMHNRVRMVVASFLCKDLLLSWQWGERYFMSKLVDGDLSANNGGWQWSASVGTDPKPLRIFNPNTQAARYDSQAEYIRTWLPELATVEPALLVNSERFAPLLRVRCGYPEPIVDHKRQQQVFKERYRAIKAPAGVPEAESTD